LARADLSPAERALHVARRKELYEAEHPETKNGAAGRGRKKVRQVGEPNERFTEDNRRSSVFGRPARGKCANWHIIAGGGGDLRWGGTEMKKGRPVTRAALASA
jgi:hypothetical protein